MKILFDLFDMVEREVECIVDAGAYLDKYWWFFIQVKPVYGGHLQGWVIRKP